MITVGHFFHPHQRQQLLDTLINLLHRHAGNIQPKGDVICTDRLGKGVPQTIPMPRLLAGWGDIAI
jgi:hypothetical protein